MKLEGFYKKLPIYSHPDCPPDTIYFMNDNPFKINYPKRKDGKLDMRFYRNKVKKLLKSY